MATQNVKVNSNGPLHVSNQGPTTSDGSWGRVSYNLTNNNAMLKQHVTGYSGSTGTKVIQNVPVTNQNMGDVVRSMYGGK